MMGRLSRFNQRHRSAIVWTLRVIIGATFMLSGLAKAIDPWGTIYKIEQYLSVWGMDITRSLVVAGSMALSSTEFILGTLLLTGCYKRTSVWLLTATMAFMLPLSLYIAIYDPVADCGCFGDLLIISNTATFVKNIVITSALIYLCVFNRTVKGLYNPYLQWIVATILAIYILAVNMHGYNIQPLGDFRPYKVGTRLAGADDDGADDEGDYSFIYEKDGVEQRFDIDNLPDSTWRFMDRVGTDGDTDKVRTLAIFDGDEEVTDEVISEEGDEMILFIPDINNVDIANTYLINEIDRKIEDAGGQFIAVLATDSKGVGIWKDISLANYPVYTAEDTSIKEVVRGNVALVYVKDGIIEWKRTLSSMRRNEVLTTDADKWLPRHKIDGGRRLEVYSGLAAIMMLIVWAVGRGGHAVKWFFYRKNKNKSVTLHNPKEN
ncbi:MAG: hypothetical protein NC117_06695 [Pseudoflavonifractor sp.]|nr:hypothetical protein [Pseudoflavonifractor sp.]